MPVDANAAKDLFLTALDRATPAERAAFLDRACANDAELRSRVNELLIAHDEEGSFPDFLAEATNDLADTSNNPTLSAAATPDDSTRTGVGEPVGDSLPVGFLAPPREPGHLGRLDHYEIHSVVGRGGMGVVLKAFDESLDRIVAIKVLGSQYATNGTAKRRFIREAKAVAAVTHEHVVTVHGVDERAPYIVMQYVFGKSLQDRLDEKGPLELKQILRIGMQIASGLAAAHSQGLVHRDIKPSNILLENGIERVKITDFGLARAVDDASLTQSGVIAGTPMYMSPEQAQGEAVDARSDLFSLGSVLYAMCTGHAPFRASGTMAVLKRVVEDTPRSIREVNPEIPGWLEAIVFKLLAKKPEERFQSAKEVAELLEQCLAHVQQPNVKPLPATVRPPLVVSEVSDRQPGKYEHPAWGIAGGVLVVLGLLMLRFSHGLMWPSLLIFIFGSLLLVQCALQRVRYALYLRTGRDWRHTDAPADATDSSLPTAAAPSSNYRKSISAAMILGFGGLVLVLLGHLTNRIHGLMPGDTDTTMGTVMMTVGFGSIGVCLLLLLLTFVYFLAGRSEHRRLSLAGSALPAPRNSKGTPVQPIVPGVMIGLMAGCSMVTLFLLMRWITDGPLSKTELLIVASGSALLVVLSIYHFINQRRGKLRAARLRRILEIGVTLVFIVAALVAFELLGFLNLANRIRPLFYHELTLSVVDSKTAVELWSSNDTDDNTVERSYIAELALEPVESILNLNQKRVRLAPGNYWMRATKDGALAEERLLKIDWGGKQNLKVGEWHGRVHVENYNTGVTVYVDGLSINSGRSMAFGAGKHFWKAIDKSGKEVASGQFLLQGESTYALVVPPIDKEVGFVPLFNRKDLTGWKPHPDQPGNWRVEDGALVGSGPGAVSHLFSERDDYENFHLRAEARINFRTEKGVYFGNSGIYFRTPQTLARMGRYPAGYEAQIFAGDTTPLLKGKERNRTGSLYELKPYERIVPGADAGEWFTLEVLARGSRITIKVNGVTTVDEFEDASFRRGHLALQQVGDKTIVQFRKIEIKELPAAKNLPFILTPPKVLEHMLGAWSAEVTQIIDPGQQVPTKHVGRMLIEPVAGGRCIIMRTQTDKGGPDDLQLVEFDRDNWEFRGMYFDPKGTVRGPTAGRFDAATRTVTSVSQPEDGLVRVRNTRFPDADTIEFDVVHRDKDGKTVFDRRATFKRLRDRAEIPEAGAADAPKEMARLDRLVGNWDGHMASSLPPGQKWNTELTGRKILGGRFIEIRERILPSGEENYTLSTFDVEQNVYRQWYVSSRWPQAEGTGIWDESAKTLKWACVNKRAFAPIATTLIWKVVSMDKTDFHVTVKDHEGTVLEDIEGSHTRRAAKK